MSQNAGSILVVDDDPLLLRTYDRILSSWGHAIETASTAEDALGLQQEKDYDLILLDLVLPGMSGIDFLRNYKRENNPPEVIVLTGYATLETAVEATKLGAHGYMTKPCNNEELKKQVGRILNVRKDPLIAFMKEHPDKVESREDLARRFGISPGTVLNRVRKATNQSFFDYLQACRIDRAKRYLEQTELNISQIAARVGFRTHQAFTRTFRRLSNNSPRQFRRLARSRYN